MFLYLYISICILISTYILSFNVGPSDEWNLLPRLGQKRKTIWMWRKGTISLQAKKIQNPLFSLYNRNDLLEKWMRWQTFQLSLLWARVQLSLWSSGADKTKEITDSAVAVPEWILLSVRKTNLLSFGQDYIDTSFIFSFALFINNGPRKYCHIDCIAKWLSFKW